MGVTTVDRLVTNIEVNVDKALAGMKKFEQRVAKVQKRIKLQNRFQQAGFSGTESLSKKNAVALAKAEDRIRKAKLASLKVTRAQAKAERQREKAVRRVDKRFKGLQGAMFSAGLSMLFIGMAIARFFRGILTSIFTTFLQVEGETGVVNNMVGNLVASLENLKFKLVSSFLETGALEIWIERVERLIDLFTGFSPETQAFLVNFAINAFLIGTALMIVGQATLGFLAILTVLKFLLGPVLFAKFAAASLAILGPIGLVILTILGIGLAIIVISNKIPAFRFLMVSAFITIRKQILSAQKAFLNLQLAFAKSKKDAIRVAILEEKIKEVREKQKALKGKTPIEEPITKSDAQTKLDALLKRLETTKLDDILTAVGEKGDEKKAIDALKIFEGIQAEDPNLFTGTGASDLRKLLTKPTAEPVVDFVSPTEGVIPININIEGNVVTEENLLDSIQRGIEERTLLRVGSVQQ